METAARVSPWMTAEQVAEYLGVSRGRVYDYTRISNPLPVHYPPGNGREWRAHVDEVDEWALRTWRRKM